MAKIAPVGECSSCHRTLALPARGLCRSCYARWNRSGSVEYVRNFKNRECTIEGCEGRQHGQGLCSKHLLRLRRTGTTDEGRGYTHKARDPESFITRHDLYPTWRDLTRGRTSTMVSERWTDFTLFAEDVGSRPSKRHRLYPINKRKPIGPGNYQWQVALIDKDPNETSAEYATRVRFARRDAYGTYYRDSELRAKYGIGLDDFLRMAEEQDYKCAICRKEEQELRTGIPKALAVDHDHITGKVRALLCHPCNKGLGYFRDRPALMSSALDYLIKHSTNPAD